MYIDNEKTGKKMNKFSEQILKLNLEIEKVFPEMDSLDIEIEKLNLYKEITEELNEGMSPEATEEYKDVAAENNLKDYEKIVKLMVLNTMANGAISSKGVDEWGFAI